MRALHLGPTLRQLRGHRSAAALVTSQIAIGAAVALIAGQAGNYMATGLGDANGIDEDQLTLIALQLPGTIAETPEATGVRAEVMAAVRATPSVVAATVVDSPPLALLERGPDELSLPGTLGDGSLQSYDFITGPDAASALGLVLTAGRDVLPADLAGDAVPAILPTRIAKALFPQGSPVGRRFQSRAHGSSVVVGVVEDLSFSPSGGLLAERGVIYGATPAATARMLVVARSLPGRAEAVREDLRRRLRAPAGGALSVTDVLSTRRATDKSLRAAIGTVIVIVATIVLVVLLGSVALTYSQVASRRREIGVRRALGATRRDVIAHFVIENAVFTTVGLAVGFGLFAMLVPFMAAVQKGFAVSWLIVGITLATLAILNLAATFVPAWGATRVSPVAASRTQEQAWQRS